MILKRLNRKNYTTIANEAIDDPDLSYEALGLLSYLLSRPDNWEVHIDQLRQPHGSLRKGERKPVGRDKIYAIVAELTKAGYMEFRRNYVDGKVESGYWIVREEPAPKQERNSTGADLVPGKPDVAPDLDPENLDPENLDPEKPDAYKRLTGNKHRQGLKDSRENAREREEPKPFQRKWTPIDAPDLTAASAAFDGPLAEAYDRYATGGRGAMGNRGRGIEALAALTPEDFLAATEAISRYLVATKAAHKHALTLERYVTAATWKLYPPSAPVVRIEPRSDAWCAIFWRLALSGDQRLAARARGMIRDAGFRKPYYPRPGEEIPSRAECEAMPKIERGSEEFSEWQRHMMWQAPGFSITLSADAFGEWLRVPSRSPPFNEEVERKARGARALREQITAA